MIAAIGGLTVVAMMLSYRLDKRLPPVQWTIAMAVAVAHLGGVL